MTDITYLAGCRRRLAAAEIALRAAKDAEVLERAEAEALAIAALNGSAGKNDDERKRNLTIALRRSLPYQEVLAALRDAEADLTSVQAELEVATDQRRAEEWRVRYLLVQALFESQVTSDQPGDDSSFDDVATEAATRAVQAAAPRKTYDATARYAQAEREINELWA